MEALITADAIGAGMMDTNEKHIAAVRTWLRIIDRISWHPQAVYELVESSIVEYGFSLSDPQKLLIRANLAVEKCGDPEVKLILESMRDELESLIGKAI
jgi:hypothetical protein